VHGVQPGVSGPTARVPLAVYILALGTFCMGMSEFMIAGLLPDIARDLDVSIPSVGTLISAFALGMVVGAPLTAAASVRLPRRTTLLTALVVFTLAHVLGALAPSYAVLLVARVTAAVACGTFWAVGTLIAVDLAPPHARGPAIAVMVGGLTVANVVGVPAGTLVGELLGWRATFWGVAALVLVSLLGVLRFVPRLPAIERTFVPRAEIRDLTQPRAVIALTITATSQAAVFGAFSYIAPLLRDVAKIDPAIVPFVLALFGLGSVAGVAIGGRYADRHPLKTIAVGVIAEAILLVTIALVASHAIAVTFAVGVWGIAAFSLSPALNLRLFSVAQDAHTLAAATNVSAFNIGNAAGPWLGGLALTAGLGFRAPSYVGAALAISCLPLVFVAAALDRSATVRAAELRRHAERTGHTP
jgi:DHA1 family chloramphenicol resistance protein-like MFS transporter